MRKNSKSGNNITRSRSHRSGVRGSMASGEPWTRPGEMLWAAARVLEFILFANEKCKQLDRICVCVCLFKYYCD